MSRASRKFAATPRRKHFLMALFLCSFPFLLHLSPCMCHCGVGNVGVIIVGFNFLDPYQVCKMGVLIFAYDFG